MGLNDSADLLFKIKGDSSGAVQAFQQVTSGAESLTSAFAKGTAVGNLLEKAVSKITEAVINAVPAMMQLAKATADYAGEIVDASQKTNVATETLQALKFGAEQSGESFEAVTKSLNNFAVLLGQAADGSDKAQAILDKYKITTTDTTAAVEQAILAIAGMTDANQQNSAAAELFKDKSGVVIQVIREMGGDIEATKDHLRDLGLLMSDEALQAAEAYGDQVDELDKQLSGIGRTIGTEVIPVLAELSADFSKFLQENKEQIGQWASDSVNAFRKLKFEMEQLAILFKGVAKGPMLTTDEYNEMIRQVNALQYQRDFVGTSREKQGGLLQGGEVVMPGGVLADKQAPVFTPRPGPDKEAEKAAKAAAEAARKAREEERKKDLANVRESIRQRLDAERTAFDEVQKQNEESFQAREIDQQKFNSDSLANFDAYLNNVKFILQEQFNAELKARKLSAADRQKILLEQKDIITKVEREIEKEREAALKLSGQQQVAIAKDTSAEVGAVRRRSHEEIIAQLEYEETVGLRSSDSVARAKIELNRVALQSRLQDLQDELKAVTGNAEREKAIKQDIEEVQSKIRVAEIEGRTKIYELDQKIFEQRLRKLQEELDLETKIRVEKERQEQLEANKPVSTGGGAGIGTLVGGPGGSTGQVAAATGRGGFLDAIGLDEDLVDTAENRAMLIGQSFEKMGGMIGNAVQGMADGIGNLIQQWVLYGDAGPDALRKMTAAVLANLAAQAAVEAIMELARGFAALATPWTAWQAPFHFKSAALFGAVAVTAAVAGRAIAGDVFKKDQAKGGAVGPQGSGQGTGANQGSVFSSYGDKAMIQETSRLAPGDRGIPSVRVVISIKEKPDWFDDMFQTSVNQNGKTRQIIRDTAAGV